MEIEHFSFKYQHAIFSPQTIFIFKKMNCVYGFDLLEAELMKIEMQWGLMARR
jgi:hypothetical protein